MVNYYRNGEDYVGWNADNEPELGEQPFIAPVTLGAQRRFALHHKQSELRDEILLNRRTLLIMQADFQHYWQHSLPIDQDITEGRINLTFRKVLPAKNKHEKRELE